MSEPEIQGIAVTGAEGFIGRHVLDRLRREPGLRGVPTGRADFGSRERLVEVLRGCSAVVHCAGVNRGEPENVESGNPALAGQLVAALEVVGGRPRVIYTTSTQERLDNPYGRGKRRAGEILGEWGSRSGAPVVSLVIPNVFGGGGRPFYNSVVATFCHQLALGEEPQIKEDRRLPLVYVNRVADRLVELATSPDLRSGALELPADVQASVSEVLTLLRRFRTFLVDRGAVPALGNRFELELYHTFRAYLGPKALEWKSEPRTDARGTLFEIFKQAQGGQTFFSTTKPGIIRGNHYHTRKIEKFCVVKGSAVIRMRRIGTREVIEFPVSGAAPAAVEMPVYHAHHIENTGEGELVTLFWSNEVFDPADPDTFAENVILP